MAPSSSVPGQVDTLDARLLDDLGSTLHLLARRLDTLLCGEEAPGLRDELHRMRLHVVDTLRTLREVADALDTSRDGDVSIQSALRSVVKSLARAETVAEVRTIGPLDHLPECTQATVLRVVRETIPMLERNGRASVLLVTLTIDVSAVSLVVRDDGVDLAQRRGSGWRDTLELSLAAMARTMRNAGGELRVDPCLPRGIRLKVRIPLAGRHSPDENRSLQRR